MTTESIETRAVAALARMQRIGEDMPDMHPMRHQVRAIKREAYNILDEAFNRAHQLAYMASDAVTDYDKAVKELTVVTPASTRPHNVAKGDL
jgi:hypothetical protein